MENYGKKCVTVCARQAFCLKSMDNQARDALAALAEQAQKYNTDGIDVYFFNNTQVGYNLTVSSIQPRSLACTDAPLLPRVLMRSGTYLTV